MLLVVDAGNTNIVFAVHDGTEWRGIWRIATEPQRTSRRICGLAADAARAMPG